MDRTTLPFSGPLTLTPTPGGEDPDGFFDFERLGRIAQRRMRVVLLFGLLGLALGIVYLLIAPPTYTVRRQHPARREPDPLCGSGGDHGRQQHEDRRQPAHRGRDHQIGAACSGGR